MKKITFLLATLLGVATASAQTYATDFTADDCSGTTHHLFSELDAGKIVVIAWVMPCGTCVTDPVTAKSIVDSYASSHPGQILYYLVDDFANTQCATLNNWANNYGLGGLPTFSDATISMSDYETNGMPKIVVLAGYDHQVYFNANSSTQGFQAALDNALVDIAAASISGIENQNITIYPNPVKNELTFEVNNRVEGVSIVNLLGETIVSLQEMNSTQKLDVSSWESGVYFVKGVSAGQTFTERLIITK